jgi:hypothetical protein
MEDGPFESLPSTATEPSAPPAEPLDWFRQQLEHPAPSSQTADPVRTVRQLPRFRLGSRRFTGRIDLALVCVTRNGGYDTFRPPDRPSSVRRYALLYEVDTEPHGFRWHVPLPSLVDSFEFDATVDVTWQVIEPETFVRSQERDVPYLIIRKLLPVVRSASRMHPIEASAEAERSAQQHVQELAPSFGLGQGLRVDCAIRLRRDAAERSHQARLRTARHEAEAIGPEHQASLSRERHEADRRAERIAFYERHLAKGGITALALHLAAHPDDTALILTQLSDEQAKLVTHQLHLIDQALEHNQLEDHELEVPHELIAERMSALLRAAAPSQQATDAPTELTKPSPPQIHPRPQR